MVEWPCAIERLNERGTNIFVELWRANKRNISLRIIIFGRLVVLKRNIE